MTTPVTTQEGDAQGPAKPLVQEDSTDFEQSDVSLTLLLHRHDGDPRGRLVSVVVHNFSGPPITQDFRAADLSEKSPLDNIQQAIFPVMQRFLLELAERRQEQLKAEAKRSSRATASTSVSKPSAVAVVPAPVLPAPPAPVKQRQDKAKQDAGKPAPTPTSPYQQISMF